MEDIDWFKERCWSISANKEAALHECKRSTSTTVVYPKSTQEISELLSTNKDAAVAVVCGGHSSSNVAAWAYVESGGVQDDGDDGTPTIILDMKDMSSVTV